MPATLDMVRVEMRIIMRYNLSCQDAIFKINPNKRDTNMKTAYNFFFFGFNFLPDLN